MPNKEKEGKTLKVEPQTKERFFNAIKNNDIEKIKNIVESEVPIVDTKCINEALKVALEKENWEIVKYLIEHGADVNTKIETKDGYNRNRKTALMIASKKENLELVKYLIEHGASNINEALINASMSGNLEIVKYLVEEGADVNTEIENIYYGKTALMIASKKENWEIVKYLIEKGASNINEALINASMSGNL